MTLLSLPCGRGEPPLSDDRGPHGERRRRGICQQRASRQGTGRGRRGTHLLRHHLPKLVGGNAAHVVVHRRAHGDRRLGHVHACARPPVTRPHAARGATPGGRAPAKMAAVSEIPGRRSLSTCAGAPCQRLDSDAGGGGRARRRTSAGRWSRWRWMYSPLGPQPRPSRISIVIDRDTTSRDARSLAVGAYRSMNRSPAPRPRPAPQREPAPPAAPARGASAPSLLRRIPPSPRQPSVIRQPAPAAASGVTAGGKGVRQLRAHASRLAAREGERTHRRSLSDGTARTRGPGAAAPLERPWRCRPRCMCGRW